MKTHETMISFFRPVPLSPIKDSLSEVCWRINLLCLCFVVRFSDHAVVCDMKNRKHSECYNKQHLRAVRY